MNSYKNISLIPLKLIVWVLNVFTKQIETIAFINSDLINLIDKSFKELTFYQRILLILSYNGNNFKVASLFIKNINYVHYYRLVNYPILHNYLLDNYIVNNQQQSKITNYLYNLDTSDINNNVILNKYLNKYNANIYWNTLNYNNYVTALNEVSSRKFDIVDLDLINGFYLFFKSISLKSVSRIIKINAINNGNKSNSMLERELNERYYLKVLNAYNKFYRNLGKDYKEKVFYDIIDILSKYSRIITNKEFLENLKKVYHIKYRPTDVTIFLKHKNTKKNPLTNLFIRKNKIFNKGRYSRNRQLYRTGVYWCLWMNIISVFGLYYYFYRFVFNFGYMYLPLLIFILSIFGSRIIKYRFYNVSNILVEFNYFLKVVESFIKDFMQKVFLYFLKISRNLYKNIKIFVYYLK